MTVREFHVKLSEQYPLSLSAAWDNDGIMVSVNPDNEVNKVLVALDPTDEVICYAAANGFDTVLTHHPMIFRGEKNVVPETFCGKRIIDALKNNVSVISLHTRLDAGLGGVNDSIMNILGLEERSVFGYDDSPTIARYSDIPEITAEELGNIIKRKLSCEMVRFTGDMNKKVHRLGVCGGSGGDLIFPAIKAGCDAFLTGDAGYNTAQDAAENGLVVYEIGHYHSESPVCGILMTYAEEIAGAETEFYDSCAYRML